MRLPPHRRLLGSATSRCCSRNFTFEKGIISSKRVRQQRISSTAQKSVGRPNRSCSAAAPTGHFIHRSAPPVLPAGRYGSLARTALGGKRRRCFATSRSAPRPSRPSRRFQQFLGRGHCRVVDVVDQEVETCPSFAPVRTARSCQQRK
jgi:hypothetical protein